MCVRGGGGKAGDEGQKDLFRSASEGCRWWCGVGAWGFGDIFLPMMHGSDNVPAWLGEPRGRSRCVCVYGDTSRIFLKEKSKPQ